MMKNLRLFVILILTLTFVSCSPAAGEATHEKIGYNSELKSLNVSELEGVALTSALEGVGMNAVAAEKLTESRADTAEEIFVISSTDASEGAPRLILASVHTKEGILFSVDAVWNELPADRYLDVLGIYFNIDLNLNSSPNFTDAWIYYDGESIDMEAGDDYEIHNGEKRAVAMSYDLGQLTKGMAKDKGPLIIHFDVYGTVSPSGIFNYNLWAYYDHGTKAYDRDVDIVRSNYTWKFDIKDSSSMSAVIYEMPCQSVLTYGDNQ